MVKSFFFLIHAFVSLYVVSSPFLHLPKHDIPMVSIFIFIFVATSPLIYIMAHYLNILQSPLISRNNLEITIWRWHYRYHFMVFLSNLSRVYHGSILIEAAHFCLDLPLITYIWFVLTFIFSCLLVRCPSAIIKYYNSTSFLDLTLTCICDSLYLVSYKFCL